MMNILLTGFCGTSSELLVKMARHKSIILPNNKVADSQLLIEEIGPRNYDYIFSFGQKPRIKDKICLETVAGNKTNRILTNFKYSRLKKVFEENNLSVRISDNAGTSFCNTLYWNGLDYIYNNRLNAEMIFIHIPFCDNISDPDLFFNQILTAIENF